MPNRLHAIAALSLMLFLPGLADAQQAPAMTDIGQQGGGMSGQASPTPPREEAGSVSDTPGAIPAPVAGACQGADCPQAQRMTQSNHPVPSEDVVPPPAKRNTDVTSETLPPPETSSTSSAQ